MNKQLTRVEELRTERHLILPEATFEEIPPGIPPS